MKKALKVNKQHLQTIFAFLFFGLLIAPYSNAREMTEYPRVKLQTLDKATARTMTFNAKVGSTVRFGPLYIRVQSCQKSSPIDKPESAAFLQIWELDKKNKSQWVFSGWMFASSPALSPMDHPIYDVWVLDCLDYNKIEDSSISDNKEETREDREGEGEEKSKTNKPNDAKNQDLLEQ